MSNRHIPPTREIILSVQPGPKGPALGPGRIKKKVKYTHPHGADASEVHAQTNQWIRWKCDEGDYAVSFVENQSPFARCGFSALQGQTIEAKVTGPPGTYPYCVVVFQPGGLPVVSDPRIIIS
jgi:hypothetical protein